MAVPKGQPCGANRFSIRIFLPRKTLQPFILGSIRLCISYLTLNGLRSKPFSNPTQSPLSRAYAIRPFTADATQNVKFRSSYFLLYPCYFFLSPEYFLLSAQKKFVTKFVTAVIKFVTHVRKFVICVTNFLTKNVLAERKKYQEERENYQGEHKKNLRRQFFLSAQSVKILT